jgi:hypothetical protein
VLEAERRADREGVHDPGQGRALLRDLHEHLAGATVVVLADGDVALAVGHPEREGGAAAPAGQALPGGTKARQRTITATITAIDPAMPSVTFTGPNGWKYSSKVEDKAALDKVKVGDKVDITWTEAVLLSVERGTM